MKSWIRSATVVALVVGAAAAAQAQFAPPAGSAPAAAPAQPVAQPARGAATGGIALLDVGQVFDKHARFQAEMNGMKEEVKQFEESLRQRQTQMNQKVEQLKQYQPGSDHYKKIEEDILVFQNQVKTETQLKRKEFLEREADAYFRVYREIESVVASFCQQNGIILVLRYTNQDINSKDRDAVLRGINRPVVFRQPYLDVTDAILARLNPRAPLTGAPGVPGAPGAGQQPYNPGSAQRVFVPGQPAPQTR